MDTTKDSGNTARQKLLEKGEEQGYITLEDILLEFPKAEHHVEEISELYSLLLEEGISIVDEEGDPTVSYTHLTLPTILLV